MSEQVRIQPTKIAPHHQEKEQAQSYVKNNPPKADYVLSKSELY